VLAPDSFLMKGEEVPPHTRWGGNPAREMRDAVPLFQIRQDNSDGIGAVASPKRPLPTVSGGMP
jgi:hypothetical protein